MKIHNNDDIPYERRLFLARERMHRQVKMRAEKKNKNRIQKEYEIGEKILLKSLQVSSSENEQVQKFFDIWERPAETGHRARAAPFSRKRRSV